MMLKFPLCPKRLSLLGLLLASSLWGCQTSDPSGKTLKIRTAHSNWIEEKFQTEIINIGLEKLGYELAPIKEIDYPALYVAIANQEIDYAATFYDPAHQGFVDNAGKDTMATVGTLVKDSKTGYQIDKKTAEQYNITNIEQLKDPKIAKLFDSDGDGKANLVGCNPGWACELIIDHHLETYGLEDTVEHDRGQYATLLADVISRQQQGQSVLFYAYYPHWISQKLKPNQDVEWIEVPYTTLPSSFGDIDSQVTFAGSMNLGFIQAQQRIIANKTFLSQNPVVSQWFEQVQIPIEDMNIESAKIEAGENRPKDIRRHAEEWVEANAELMDKWLENAKRVATP